MTTDTVFPEALEADHFCTTMEARLNQVREYQGLPSSPRADICNLSNNAIEKAELLPEDEFNRSAIDLIQSVSFDPFISAGYIQLCESVSNSIVNAGSGTSNADSIFVSCVLSNINGLCWHQRRPY